MGRSRAQLVVSAALVTALLATVAPAQAEPRPDPRDAAPPRTTAPAKPAPAKPSAAESLSTATGPASYAYDAAGRLVGVSHPQGEAARYRYDAAGNLLDVTRHPSSQLTVLSLVPATARPGASVTIHGTGFAATPAGNAVTFDGVAAQVTAATATMLTVTVPAGARSGPVAVAAGGASATAEFTLAPAGPVVTGMSPTTGPATTEVTLTGSGFDAALANNVVTVNGAPAEVTAATSTELKVKIPTLATSGPMEVATPDGTARAAADFVVPPTGVDPALIESVTRIEAGAAPRRIAVGTPGKVALVLFDAPAGRHTNVGLGDVTLSGGWLSATVIDPRGKVLADDSAYRPFDLDVSGTRAGATYQLLIDPDDANATAQVSVSVAAPRTGELDPAGDGVTTNLSIPGQDLRLGFDASAGDSIGLGFTGNTLPETAYVDLVAPSGAVLEADWWLAGEDTGALRRADLPETGRYEVVVDPTAVSTGALTVTYSRPVTGGPLDPTGDATTVEITRPGQVAQVRFDATAGETISLALTGNTIDTASYVSVYAPNGQVLVRDSYLPSEDPGSIRLAALAATGTYRVVVAPNDAGRGKVSVTYSKRLDAGRLDADGAGSLVETKRPAQDSELRFDATAGQSVSLGFTDNTIETSTYVTVFAPDGRKLVTDYYLSSEDDGTIRLPDLAATGTYRVVVAPNNAGMGKLTVTYSRRVDGGRLDPAAPGSVVDITRPGQDAELRFDGTQGEPASLGITANTITSSSHVSVYAPNGAVVVDREYVSAADEDSVNIASLPATGTYRVVLAPSYTARGRATVTYSRRVDAGTLDRAGPSTVVTVERPGQDAGLRFDATAGDDLSLGLTGSTLGAPQYVTVIEPNGAVLVDRKSISASSPGDVDLPRLTQTGTYRVVMAPAYAATGAVTITLSPVLDAGTLTAAGSAIAVGRAGQNATLRFTGAVGARLQLAHSDDTYPWGVYLTVRDPAGRAVVNEKWVRRTGTVKIPDLTVAGTYTVLFNPDDGGTGRMVLALTTRTTAAAPPVAKAAGPATPTAVAKEQQGTGPETWTPDAGSLRGIDWNARRPRVAAPKPLTAARGATALAGHTLTLDGRPLRGVSVRVGSVRTRTDAAGRFLLSGLRAGTATMVVDGATASSRGRRFGVFHIKVDVKAGRTTVLPYTIWMQRLDTASMMRFPSPTTRETVLTTPKVPGLEVRLPKGSVVRDGAGKIVTELGITPIPIDRPPFPLPSNGIVPVYFTVQPGGTYVFPDGARIIYPNYTRLPAGQRVDFWNYDPEHKGWYVYGHGQVSADARQVVPDADTKVWAFHGAMFNASDLLPFDLSALSDLIDWLSGDPVELSTGRLVDTRTDLALDDTMPISLTRTLWQGDSRDREFGVGQIGAYGMFLHSQKQYEQVDLYLPGGGKVHYVRTSPGTGYTDAVFEARDTAGQFRGSRIAWNDNSGWDLTLRDGMTYVFPMYSPLQSIRDRHGNQITLTRSDGTKGDLTQITSPNGRWIRISYDDERRATEARDNIGRAVRYDYDDADRLETVTDPAGKTTKYAYDGSGRVKTITDARGITYLTNTYDDAGRVSKQVLAGGTEYSFDYTVTDGRITETRVTEPGGAVRRVTFSGGVVTSSTVGHGSPLARTTSYQRGPDNRVDAMTDPAGRRTQYHYDAAGRLTSATLLAGTGDATDTGTVVYGGPFDQPSQFTDRLGKVTRYGYGAHGTLTSVTEPDGRTTRYSYDDTGTPQTLTDADGRTTRLTYRFGDLVAVTDPLGRVVRRFVDGAGRVVSTTDPAGAGTRVTYDALNQVTAVTNPLGHTTKLEYDGNGNVTSLTDPRNHTTRWDYDDADRPTTATDPLGRSATISYDAAGRPERATSRAGNVTTFGYDVLGRNTSATYQEPGAAASTVSFDYDPVGRLDTITDPAGGGPISFGWDALDRLTTLTQPQGTVGYRYDAVGRRTAMTVAGQPDVGYDYDDAGNLTSMTQGGLTVGVEHGAAGRQATLTLPGGWSQQHTFDVAGQLTGISYRHGGAEKGALHYDRDVTGRVTTVSGTAARVALPAAQTGLTYDAANRLLTAGGATLSYDHDGNLTGDGTTTYDWDARGRLTRLNRPGLTATFGYDAFGQRTSRDGTGILNDSDHPVRQGSATMLSGGVDQWFARTEGGDTRTFLTDATGSTVGLGDATGRFSTEYSYEPFGAATRTGDATSNPFTYTGREDDGSGLMYYRARYYSPTLQRFISEDPIGFAGGTNLYAYAANSPTNNTDPSGNNPMVAGCLIGGLTDGFMDWAGQRLSGRKVDWGLGGVGGAALAGCAAGALGGWLGARLGGAGSGASCAVNSFTPDTQVRMADGTSRRIADVRPGDHVLATDPETGRTEARRVVAAITGDGVKRLVEIAVDGGTVIATEGHPFWVDGRGWVDAGDLATGDRLHTGDGFTERVLGVRDLTGTGRVHNLSVDGIPTFYVVAGDEDLLVHNCKFQAVPYRPTTPGHNNHHGVMDVWTKHNVPGYPSRAPGNPTVRMPKANHDAAHEAGREWLRERTGRPVAPMDWTSVGPREIRDLSERMFDAAEVPASVRQEYYSALTRYLYGLGQ